MALNYLCYYNKTNYNLYLSRNKARALKGTRATVTVPPSQGQNLQLLLAVSPTVGVLHWQREQLSVDMDVVARCLKAIYEKAIASDEYKRDYAGKTIVIIYDNAPAHSQSEKRVKELFVKELEAASEAAAAASNNSATQATNNQEEPTAA